MPQIAFLTLFLGLVSGTQPVALSVVGEPAAVEVLLDGQAVTRLAAPPWRASVDFGTRLLPHVLSARTLDATGRETARVVQFLNLPRPPAEATLQLEGGGDGQPPTARILWQSLTGAPPLAIAARLDGKELAVEAGGRVALPPFDPTLPHVLSAELRFSNGVVARRDAAFGGDLGDELRTEITAVPLRWAGHGRVRELPAGALRVVGAPAHAVATEDAPARLLVVRDPAALALLLRLQRRGGVAYSGAHRLTPSVPTVSGDAESLVRAATGETLRFLWPQAAPKDLHGAPLKLFDGSREFGAADGTIGWLLTHVLEPSARTEKPRFADAVAVAGLQALGGNGRRAVLLILAAEPADPSQYDATAVMTYLAAVRVPTFVWRLERLKRSAASGWGKGELIGSAAALAAAIDKLQDELQAQRIVWIDGAHAPQEIELAAAARAAGWRFAGEER